MAKPFALRSNDQFRPVVEEGWAPLLGTPNHPEYPSAHGCFTGALGYALAELMGTTKIDLDVAATNGGVPRHYTWRDDLLAEVGEARIWGGLHYRTSVEVGLRIGQRVVAYNLHRNFRPA
ncbi:MAG: hypothetical protein ABW219_16560 [Ilumatobacteraceae bacterium]